MQISGLNKTTLLDYPGLVACTIFLAGCNFRCPFCQNSGLVVQPASQPRIPMEEVLSFLKKRRRILEGVCISGGEPTLCEELPAFIEEIKKLGYKVKLDTNGSRPYVVKSLVKAGLLDKVAMDIKSSPDHYGLLSGLKHPNLEFIQESIDFLMQGSLDYEFRTTVVKELHTEQDFAEIGQWLRGAKAYYLQAYKDSDGVLQPGFTSYSFEELQHFQKILEETIPTVQIRGID